MVDRVWMSVAIAGVLVAGGGELASAAPGASASGEGESTGATAVGGAESRVAANGAATPATAAKNTAPIATPAGGVPAAEHVVVTRPEAEASALVTDQGERAPGKPGEPTRAGATPPAGAGTAQTARAAVLAASAADLSVTTTAALLAQLQIEAMGLVEDSVLSKQAAEARDQVNKALADSQVASIMLHSLLATEVGSAGTLDVAAVQRAADRAARAANQLLAAADVVAALIPVVAPQMAAVLATSTSAALERVAAMDAAVRALAKPVASEQSDERSPGAAGLPLTSGPTWTLVGDAQTSSVDFSKPSLSVGLEYATSFALARVVVRKSANQDSITAVARDRAFGDVVLSPSRANFGLSAHGELGRSFRCQPNCNPHDVVVNSTLRGYGTFEISQIQLGETDTQMHSGTLTPVALSLGGVYRIEGRMPTGKQFGSDRLGMNLYLGGTARLLSGLHGSDLQELLGSTSRWYAGVEGGVALQVGNVLVDPRVTYLPPVFGGGKSVAGLTGAQVQINLTFVLPWEFAGAGKP